MRKLKYDKIDEDLFRSIPPCKFYRWDERMPNFGEYYISLDGHDAVVKGGYREEGHEPLKETEITKNSAEEALRAAQDLAQKHYEKQLATALADLEVFFENPEPYSEDYDWGRYPFRSNLELGTSQVIWPIIDEKLPNYRLFNSCTDELIKVSENKSELEELGIALYKEQLKNYLYNEE